jgi:hypothetical protein
MASPAVRPWFYRLVEAIPARPIWAVTAVAAGCMALQSAAFAIHLWASASPTALGYLISTGLLRSAVLACTIGAGWFVVKGFALDLATLRPAVACSDAEFERLRSTLTEFPLRGLVVASLAGPLVAFGVLSWEHVPLLLGGSAVAFRDVSIFAYITLFYTVALPIFYVIAVAVFRMWRFGRSQVGVDLLDPDALTPFGRFGLRLALLLNLGFGLIPVAEAIRTPEAAPFIFGVFAPVALLGFAALAVPSGALHRRIRETKTAELARVRSALAGDRRALAGSPLAAEVDRLTTVDLALWRDRVAALREWPFDASVLRRFGLYLLIPLASWVGAAFVERVVDRFF